MTLRRLLLAFLLSVVVGLFSSSVSAAASFQGAQVGIGSHSSLRLVQHYDETPKVSTYGGSSVGFAITAGISVAPAPGRSVQSLGVARQNTPPAARTAAADTAGGLSVDNAAAQAIEHAGPGARWSVTSKGNPQLIGQPFTNAAGETQVNIGRMDMWGWDNPHLNLETQINGRSVDALDPHYPIDPTTIP